jgi:putative salt-induced outer membrane protein YdiY
MKRMAMTAVAVVLSGIAWAEDAPVEQPWKSTVAAGVNLSRGNTHNMLLNGSAVSEYKKDANEARIGIEANYGETEVTTTNGEKKTETNVENSKAFAEYRRLLNERLYAYAKGEVLNDDIANIDLRCLLGPGLGYYLLKSEVQTLGVEGGVTYIRQKLADVPADDYVALRAAQTYTLKVSKTAKIWESVEYLPAIDDASKYFINAEVGAEAAMNSRLSLRIVAQDKYNNEPAAGKKANDLQLIGGFTYRL